MSKVRLELTRPGPGSRIFIDDVEIEECRAVQVFASVDNPTIVVLELQPTEVVIVGEANVGNTLEPRLVSGSINMGGDYGETDAEILEHNRQVAERLERNRRRAAPARAAPPAAPVHVGTHAGPILRCANTLGEDLRCERMRNHAGQCLAVERADPIMDTSITGQTVITRPAQRLMTFGVGGPAELRAGTCHHCGASLLVQHLVITPPSAEPFRCRNTVDCEMRWAGDWPQGVCCTPWANREDEHAADCPVVTERTMQRPLPRVE